MKNLLDSIRGSITSKTVWFNALVVAGFVIDILAKTEFVRSNADLVVILTALGNIILRYVTTKPLSEK